MKPDPALLKSLPNGVSAYALAEPGKQYAVYLSRVVAEKGADGKETARFFDPQSGKAITVTLALPAGTYSLAWLDPRTGKRRNLGTFGSRAAAQKHEREVQYFKRH